MERRSQLGEGEGKAVDVAMGVPRQEQKQLECFSDEVNSREEAGVKETRGEAAGAEVSGAGRWGGGGGGEGVAKAAVAKRRRGRPPGSKNKPKPPVLVTREAPEPAAAMRPHVLEIPGGGDVAGALAGFARRRGLGICVLAGTGAVANVSLRHPLPPTAEISGAAAAAVVVFHGRYDILSISATFLPPAMSAAAPRALGGLSISLAGPHGQIVGGAVAGPLVAATTVVVVAAAFTSPTFHRLPAEDDDAPAPASVSGSGADADEHRRRQTDPQEHHHHLTPLHPRSIAPATTTQPVYASPSARQHGEAWTPAAASPRPPYQ
ncbi:AT-hook motif nuclear-localized protein 17-like [Oryza brachyantha]|uniref:AT-hook motif nuclear-localized protein 17-like n=1 Tax=Oryza brachyantha TaxID=4533 RepID=UPI001ADAD081|nr:AT-hook motif nuclear-localized protein 17-like [Oryza brachyantha]